MGKEKFGAEAISRMDDGRVRAAIDRAIQECASDIDDRGEDGAKRSVTIKIEFKPVLFEGKLDSVETEMTVDSSIPVRRSRPYSMSTRMHGGKIGFLYNEDSADNIKQGTLDEANKRD